jgi:hypothetical protein
MVACIGWSLSAQWRHCSISPWRLQRMRRETHADLDLWPSGDSGSFRCLKLHMDMGMRNACVKASPLHTLGHRITRQLVASCSSSTHWLARMGRVLYDAAQGRSITQNLDPAMLLGTAALFRWPLLPPTEAPRRCCRCSGVCRTKVARCWTAAQPALALATAPFRPTLSLSIGRRSKAAFVSRRMR